MRCVVALVHAFAGSFCLLDEGQRISLLDVWCPVCSLGFYSLQALCFIKVCCCCCSQRSRAGRWANQSLGLHDRCHMLMSHSAS